MRKYKTSVTTKDYKVVAFGYNFTVPKGSKVNNCTACGYDDSYHFWKDWQKQVEEITGFKDSCLAFDLTYYGLNIPTDYCKPYK